tara:strand:- start:113 stop:334 length:222 start_codon:yes stop_codon:yes gene_type:complete
VPALGTHFLLSFAPSFQRTSSPLTIASFPVTLLANFSPNSIASFWDEYFLISISFLLKIALLTDSALVKSVTS